MSKVKTVYLNDNIVKGGRGCVCCETWSCLLCSHDDWVDLFVSQFSQSFSQKNYINNNIVKGDGGMFHVKHGHVRLRSHDYWVEWLVFISQQNLY